MTRMRTGALAPLLALLLILPSHAAAPAPAVSVTTLPALGGTVASGAPVVATAAGQTAMVALVVRAPANASVGISLAGDLKSPRGKLTAARLSVLPVGRYAPYGDVQAAVAPVEGAGAAAKRVYWLRARVPRGQPAGIYRGVVRVSATVPGRTAPLRAESPVNLEVLPFDLMGGSRQYVWLGRSAWENATELLAGMREIGVLTAGVCGPVEELWPALEQCRSQGSRGAVPYLAATAEERAQAAALEAARREKQLPPVLWLFGAEQVTEAAEAGSAGAPVGALLSASDPLPDPPVDTLIRRVDAAAVAAYLKSPIPPLKSPKPGEPPARRLVQWWSWDMATATPAQNRLFAGFLLWRSGFTGACLEESQGEAGDPAALARRWEAVRAGVDDVRYLTTYYSLVRQLRDKDRRHPLPDRAEAELSAVLAKLTPDSSMASADAARRALVRWITAIRLVVK
jgi:hypothetical protein